MKLFQVFQLADFLHAKIRDLSANEAEAGQVFEFADFLQTDIGDLGVPEAERGQTGEPFQQMQVTVIEFIDASKSNFHHRTTGQLFILLDAAT